MNKRRFERYDDVQLEYYKKHPKELKGYLAVALEEYQKDGDEKAFLSALSLATRVHGGFSKLSKATGSTFNLLASKMGSGFMLPMHSFFFATVIGLWFLLAFLLGRRFEQAITNNEVIGAEKN